MLVFALIVALMQTQPGPPGPSPQAPIPPASAWDGVAGYEAVVTDPETGQITYPMGQQPEDALARGCVFGIANVRCPRPHDPEATRSLIGAYAEEVRRRNAQIDFETPRSERVNCWSNGETIQPGQRRCTFDEALHNSYVDRSEAEARAATRRPGRLGFGGQGPTTPAVEGAPEPPAERNGCRRVEYRYPDGSGGGVRWECTHTTGSGPAADAVSEALRSSPR